MSDEEDKDKPKLSKAARDILAGLTAREAKVLREKFGVDLSRDISLDEIGKQFDITRERIKEIEERAIEKIRKRKEYEKPRCSFCGKGKDEVEKLISSTINDTYICGECIKTCTDFIDE